MNKKVILICEECLARNYHTSKNKFLTNRLSLKKYCPTCNQSTTHNETR